ncbi:TcpE family conjugal transfer membrane protein [Margalitia sp. FSL K6-0131]|uniref:TcpE family conjugal transfer membrane protein n=1 Tax=Margalitia sp. FSL K6-0131 TaxID=2954604 RepID=UPI0030F93C00
MEYQEDGHVYVRTYKRMWRFERYFYSFDRFKLPRPITWWQLWYFLIAELVIIVINANTPLLVWVNTFIVKFVVFPGVISFYLSRKKHDGKSPHKFFYSQIKYYLLPKIYCRYKKVSRPGIIKYSNMIKFRENYELPLGTDKKKKK